MALVIRTVVDRVSRQRNLDPEFDFDTCIADVVALVTGGAQGASRACAVLSVSVSVSVSSTPNCSTSSGEPAQIPADRRSRRTTIAASTGHPEPTNMKQSSRTSHAMRV